MLHLSLISSVQTTRLSLCVCHPTPLTSSSLLMLAASHLSRCCTDMRWLSSLSSLSTTLTSLTFYGYTRGFMDKLCLIPTLELAFKPLGSSHLVQSVSYCRSQSSEHRHHHRQKLTVEGSRLLRHLTRLTSYNVKPDLYVTCCVASLTA
jgi:hypothetical protein